MGVRARKLVGSAMVGFACLALDAQPLWAQSHQQSRQSTWEVELHGGLVTAGRATSGTPLATFPVGDPVVTPRGLTSRAISSWFFGDGARLLNECNTSLGTNARVAPLDPMLRSAAARAAGGVSVGGRITRRLTPRLSAEFAFDYLPGSIEFSEEAREAIDEASASFIEAWQGFLSISSSTNRDVISSAVVTGSGRQVFAAGGLRFDLPARGRFTPYLSAGVGSVLGDADAPEATITGQYSFTFGGGQFPFNESDQVRIRAIPDGGGAAFVVGGGFNYALSPRRALRVNAQMVVLNDPIVVDADPDITLLTPAFAISTFAIPSVQFSNDPSTGRDSSLSGPSVSGLETFAGRGRSVRFDLSIGYVIGLF